MTGFWCPSILSGLQAMDRLAVTDSGVILQRVAQGASDELEMKAPRPVLGPGSGKSREGDLCRAASGLPYGVQLGLDGHANCAQRLRHTPAAI
jgi:hypothetical protein